MTAEAEGVGRGARAAPPPLSPGTPSEHRATMHDGSRTSYYSLQSAILIMLRVPRS